jgi:hypothetical protein
MFGKDMSEAKTSRPVAFAAPSFLIVFFPNTLKSFL